MADLVGPRMADLVGLRVTNLVGRGVADLVRHWVAHLVRHLGLLRVGDRWFMGSNIAGREAGGGTTVKVERGTETLALTIGDFYKRVNTPSCDCVVARPTCW